ncbi:MAG: Stp1/IreP family PP2C-type Ser/Thr phosphatase [Candidatus Aminicenantes bacterium]|nr:Stp1/IreP family PP2C-type Ser/Thr phosphatase [Candidatus Aminicenantes bacterium]NIM79510.1 Stp1/IreP family PP2C-type Ser/Thr phosphatase [Candidatus Aminicenantes bacterium]NIN18794.1 Stp1/IreP family PP2C-type Ser/Thr phosphatase [Candidatus Aminicenantes bacterium]NIN42716.1 Stp1/IreP family PP2C-type Ser/Thr phosphatase [Candidatus Aminicenantes bacterium]NIN85450.1 Stp1/IreP family PP2C-type Ser/Thr phosphatase [Candidatus Aminicenantes bacterium]
MELFYSGLSDVGNLRENNEDYYFAGKLGEDEYLFIVADGMGGHKAGEVASRKAVSFFVRELEKGIGDNISEDLRRIILAANEFLMHEGSRSAVKNGMGTTLSVFYVQGNLGYIVHVGDSRIYRFTNPDEKKGNQFVLEQLTEDHSFVGKLLKEGFITEEEARRHPRRNVLYQSIGLKKDINVQVLKPIPIQKGQKYLLCTDGLYGVVPESEIAECLKEKSTAYIVRVLVQKAKANGGPDNISTIVVSTEKDKIFGEDTVLEDTIRIVLRSKTKKRKKRKRSFFILLGLLVLLLVVIIYWLLTTISTSQHPLPGSGSGGESVTETMEK